MDSTKTKRKIAKALNCFRFAEAARLLDEAYNEVQQKVKRKDVQPIEGFSNTPPGTRFWIDPDRKSENTNHKLNTLVPLLTCKCEPVDCECDHVSEETVPYNSHCWACSESLPRGTTGFWLNSQNHWLCFVCEDILFDKLYPERAACTKIRDLIDDAFFFVMPPVIYSEALERLARAREWSLIASGFPRAARN
ncbi:MAG: hypothetical protein K2X81_05870 [Candidatus Obscuribacterales bacterium]|nr:hypothetical protein [Candidatus Obscuribacterales bacterium]